MVSQSTYERKFEPTKLPREKILDQGNIRKRNFGVTKYPREKNFQPTKDPRQKKLGPMKYPKKHDATIPLDPGDPRWCMAFIINTFIEI